MGHTAEMGHTWKMGLCENLSHLEKNVTLSKIVHTVLKYVRFEKKGSH